MTELLRLKGEERVLEVGTGSGYQAAILSLLCKWVYSIERLQSLSDRARALLESCGYNNVTLFVGDGTKGLPSEAPFDGIIVHCRRSENSGSAGCAIGNRREIGDPSW